MLNLIIKVVAYSALFGCATFIVLKFNGHKKLIKLVKTIVDDFKTGYNSPQGTSFMNNIRNGLTNIRFGIGRTIELTYEGSYKLSRIFKHLIRKFRNISVEEEDMEEADKNISSLSLCLNSWKDVEFFDTLDMNSAKFYIGINKGNEYILKVNIDSLPKLKAPNIMNNIFVDEDNCVWINSKGMIRASNSTGHIDEIKFNGYKKVLDAYKDSNKMNPKDIETETIEVNSNTNDNKNEETPINRKQDVESNEDNIMNIF